MNPHHHTCEQPIDRSDLVVLALLWTLFFSTYWFVGHGLAETYAFNRFDLLFDADVPRVVRDFTSADANHYRTKVHPLYVLFLNPFGQLLTQLSGSTTSAAIIMNASFGALDVALIYLLLRTLRITRISAASFAAIGGLSAAHFFFGSLPETVVISSASLLMVLIVQRVIASGHNWPLLIPAGVFSMGMSSINIVFVALCCAFIGPRDVRTRITRTVIIVAFVLVITMGFSVIQKALYPSAQYFFTPSAFTEDLGYVNVAVLRAPTQLLSQFITTVGIYAVVAPRIITHEQRDGTDSIDFAPMEFKRDGHSMVFFGALLVYVVLGMTTAVAVYQHRLYTNKIFLTLAAHTAFSLIFFLFYNPHAPFLFTPTYLVAILSIMSMAHDAAPRMPPVVRLLPVALCALLAINDARFIHEVLAVYT